jgi:glycopeptide antibiotics resistance protein
MRLLVPLAIAFLAMNAAILGGGLAKLESPEAKAMLSGYPAHLMAFFILAFVLSLILLRLHVHHAYIISFCYAVMLAVMLEVLQGFTGYRHFSFLDMGFGAIGAGLHWMIARGLGKRIHYGID